jgi:tetratricopeptide (TPR) repeat protein
LEYYLTAQELVDAEQYYTSPAYKRLNAIDVVILRAATRELPAALKAVSTGKALHDLFGLGPLLKDTTAACTEFSKHYSARAIEDGSRDIGLFPSSPTGHVRRGHGHFNAKSYDAAAADYSKAVELDPKNLRVILRLGETFMEMQKYPTARDTFKKAIELDPSSAEAHAKHCWAIYENRSYDDAIPSCSQSIRLNANDAFPWMLRGHAHLARERYVSAIADIARRLNWMDLC